MTRDSLSEQLANWKGNPMPLHPKRHTTALKIAVALHRAERACKDPHTPPAPALHQLVDMLVSAGTITVAQGDTIKAA